MSRLAILFEKHRAATALSKTTRSDPFARISGRQCAAGGVGGGSTLRARVPSDFHLLHLHFVGEVGLRWRQVLVEQVGTRIHLRVETGTTHEE